jgi:hypothetical protein
MKATIVRLEQSTQGALGAWLFDGVIFCFTLQPDAADPKKFHIPSNTPEHPFYICTRYHSPKHGDTFVISRSETPGHIDGHDYLEVHPGNDEDDTLGCTVVGSSVAKLKGVRSITNSGLTFKLFMERLKGVDSFELRIIDCYTG